MSEQTVCYLYIASCVPAPDGGIYRYRLTDGIPEPAGFTPMPSPMYMITDFSGKEPAMHVVLLDPYGRRESGLVTYRIAENGDLPDGTALVHPEISVIISGYVPDLLKSISMISRDKKIVGAGMCGKGYKEWVRVSDGGPSVKARAKLG